MSEPFAMPGTFEAILILLVFSVPGYIALQRYSTNYPVSYYRRAPTTLGEVSLYVSISVLINIVIIILFFLLVPLFKPDVNEISYPLEISNLNDVADIAIAAVIYLFMAFVVVYLLTLKPVLEQFLRPDLPLWWEELVYMGARQQVEYEPYWLQAQFKVGGRCLGVISKMRWVGGQENTIEVILEHAYYWPEDKQNPVDVGQLLFRTKEVTWLGLYST